MVENIKHVASSDQELTIEECNLLLVVYKNGVGACHASWRIVAEGRVRVTGLRLATVRRLGASSPRSVKIFSVLLPLSPATC